jgi:hypothetical protein
MKKLMGLLLAMAVCLPLAAQDVPKMTQSEAKAIYNHVYELSQMVLSETEIPAWRMVMRLQNSFVGLDAIYILYGASARERKAILELFVEHQRYFYQAHGQESYHMFGLVAPFLTLQEAGNAQEKAAFLAQVSKKKRKSVTKTLAIMQKLNLKREQELSSDEQMEAFGVALQALIQKRAAEYSEYARAMSN